MASPRNFDQSSPNSDQEAAFRDPTSRSLVGVGRTLVNLHSFRCTTADRCPGGPLAAGCQAFCHQMGSSTRGICRRSVLTTPLDDPSLVISGLPIWVEPLRQTQCAVGPIAGALFCDAHMRYPLSPPRRLPPPRVRLLSFGMARLGSGAIRAQGKRGRVWPEFGDNRPNPSDILPKLFRLPPTSTGIRPNSVEHEPKLVELEPNLVDFGPNSAYFDRSSGIRSNTRRQTALFGSSTRRATTDRSCLTSRVQRKLPERRRWRWKRSPSARAAMASAPLSSDERKLDQAPLVAGSSEQGVPSDTTLVVAHSPG